MKTEAHESQKKICRRLLKAGKKLTPLQMLNKYGIMRLASRMNDLKNEGMKIHTELIHCHPVKYAPLFVGKVNKQKRV